MVLAPAGRLLPSQILDVSLEVLPSAPRALRSRVRVRLHVHTTEVLGRLQILEESGEIPPGGKGLAQLRLESPVVTHADERFIIRSYSPSITVAGGKILNPFAVKHRRKELARVRQTLNDLEHGNRAAKFVAHVAEAKEGGLRFEEVAARTGWQSSVVTAASQDAQKANEIVDCEKVFIARGFFESLSQSVLAEVKQHHKREPLSRGLARETLRDRVFHHSPAEIFRCVLKNLEVKRTLIVEKDVLRGPEHSLELSGEDAELRNRLNEIFRRAGLQPPTPDAALKMAIGSGKPDPNRGRRILQILIETKQIVRVQTDLVFHRTALDDLISQVRTYADTGAPDRTIDVARFKELAGVSRKYAIPLLEFLDREHVTRREGERRMIL
jgi:selenocysteine-specific elongation factor